MTEFRDNIDLDEYSKLLTDLENEIRAYGNQRNSLQEMVTTLQAIDATISKLTRRVESSIGTGELVLDQLNDLDLPKHIASLQSRYNEHQQSLYDVSGKMQQIVQEQQRGSLEALQNAQHAREALDRQAKAAEAQEAKIAGVGDQVSTVGDKVAGQVDQVLNALQTQNEKLEEVKRQLAVSRIVAIVTLVAVIAFGLATAFNVI